MRHTTKMLLIPEDVYKALVFTADAHRKDRRNILFNSDKDLPDLLVDSHKEDMKELLRRHDLNPDEKQIRYMQLFKRYKKFLDDRNNRPIKVRVDNLDTVKEEIKKLANSWQHYKSPNRSHIIENSHMNGSPEQDFNYRHPSDGLEEAEAVEEVDEDENENINEEENSDTAGVSGIGYSPLGRKLRPIIRKKWKFDPYRGIKPSPSLIPRHKFFATNKRDEFIDNPDRTDMLGKGQFKPTLWF